MIELIMKIQASSRFKQAPTYLVIKVKFSNRRNKTLDTKPGTVTQSS